MPEKPKVVILGGGFAGLTAVRTLQGQGFSVTLVDRHNYHLFQPLLYQVATGELLSEAIATPLRSLLPGWGATFYWGQIASIDLASRRVRMDDGASLSYDYLFIALGSVTNFFGNTHIEQHALHIKGLSEAEAVRSSVLRALEKASQSIHGGERRAWLHFVVAGGGATGVEFSAALAETLAHLVPQEYPDLDPEELKITLVHGDAMLLPGFSKALQLRAAVKLQRAGVELRLRTHVADYDGEIVRCTRGNALAARTLVWTAGVTANPCLDHLNVPRGKGGRFLVDEHLRLLGNSEVFVLGDLAEARDSPSPQVAPFAIQSALHAAHYLCSQQAPENAVPPFRYRDPGIMAVLGRFDAVCEIPRWKLHWAGLSAWVLWLALHLYRIVGTGNRLTTLLNWSVDYLRRGTPVQLIRATPKAEP